MTGRIVTLDLRRGFAFVEVPELGRDQRIFCHASECGGSIDELEVGDLVEVRDLYQGARGLRATHFRRVERVEREGPCEATVRIVASDYALANDGHRTLYCWRKRFRDFSNGRSEQFDRLRIGSSLKIGSVRPSEPSALAEDIELVA